MAVLSRRQVLAGGLGAAATTMTGRLWARPAAAASSGVPLGVPAERVLVVVTLSGGNDGLNTVIPYEIGRASCRERV